MWQTDATLPKERMLDGWFQQQRSHFFLIATLSFTLLFTGLHRGDLSGYDDAAYAHEAKQILKSGDWWTLRLNGYPDFDKPPMFVWILAVSMKIFGITDFAAKFPSALAGFLTIVLVFFLTRELTDDFWIPILAMFVMATTQYFLKYAMHAMTCVPFSFFFTLAIFTYVKALDRPPYFLAFGLSAGIASLIRSPMGYFPLAIIVLHLIFIRRYSLFRSGYFIGCVILSVALPLSWYAVMHYRHGAIFWANHIANITAHVMSGGSQSVWQKTAGYLTYPFLLLKLYWPWLPAMILGSIVAARNSLRNREIASSLLLIWIICLIVPFSFADNKVLRYIMPVFPAFSILSAFYLRTFVEFVHFNFVFKRTYQLLIVAVAFLSLFPNYRVRAGDMRKLAPIAAAATSDTQRIILYNYGELRWDYRNQLIWYGNRLCEQITDIRKVEALFNEYDRRVIIMDKPSFEQFFDERVCAVEILGETDNFVCFR